MHIALKNRIFQHVLILQPRFCPILYINISLLLETGYRFYLDPDGQSLRCCVKMMSPTDLNNKCNEGFTLIELLCVIAIIGIMAAISAPLFITYRDRAMRFETEVELRLLEKEMTGYYIYHKVFPNSIDDIGMGHLLDAWGNPYQYLRIDGANNKGKGKFRKDRFLVPINSDYDLYSMGPDGKSVSPLTAKASRDDIIRANDGAYFGPAYLY